MAGHRRVADPENWRLATGDWRLVQANSNLYWYSYWYSGAAIYLHTAQVGKPRAVLDAGPQHACFTVTDAERAAGRVTMRAKDLA